MPFEIKINKVDVVDIYGQRWFIEKVDSVVDPQDYGGYSISVFRVKRDPDTSHFYHILAGTEWQLYHEIGESIPQTLPAPALLRFDLTDECHQSLLAMWMLRKEMPIRISTLNISSDAMDVMAGLGYLDDPNRAVLNAKSEAVVETVQTWILQSRVATINVGFINQKIEIYNQSGYFAAHFLAPNEPHWVYAVGVENFIEVLGQYATELLGNIPDADHEEGDYAHRIRRMIYYVLTQHPIPKP